jgi:hypothetical protein
MSSGTQASRDSAAGPDLARMDDKDMPSRSIRAKALRGLGHGGWNRFHLFIALCWRCALN